LTIFPTPYVTYTTGMPQLKPKWRLQGEHKKEKGDT